MALDSLSIDEARRIALEAQGFTRSRPRGPVSPSHLRRVIRQLGLLQLDYVNVLVPAHYLVLFSRLGPYPRRSLDELVYQKREFTEQWAHEASILPVEAWPLLGPRRETCRVRPYNFTTIETDHRSYIDWVLEEIRRRGPLSADDLPGPEGVSRRIPGAWYGTIPRIVLEAHFTRGRLAVVARRQNLARIYDLAERVIPPEHYDHRMNAEEAQRELLRLSARAHGIGLAADLGDYYRLPLKEARLRLNELVAAGELREVRVEGWSETAYLHPAAKLPARIDAAALLSPFDPVVWFRARAARLFGFDYRIEIYTPEAQRKWGYYVLPFLLGDRLVARIDLKADRAAKHLLVLAAYNEPGVDVGAAATAISQELKSMAVWLGLDAIRIIRRDGFNRVLAAACARK
jgi:uncharacterized protein YcaQ